MFKYTVGDAPRRYGADFQLVSDMKSVIFYYLLLSES